MDGRGVQRILAAHHAQEAGCLFKRFVAQARHGFQGRARSKRALHVAVADDALRHAGRQAGDACQQRRRGRIHIHADGVHAIFHHGVERAGQLALAHVVLVLAHADRFRVNLDQFGQRILQAARDRHGAAQGHIHVRQFLGGEFGRRIHRRARFRDDDLRHLRFRVLLDQVLRQLVRLARGGAVADRDQRHIVLGG